MQESNSNVETYLASFPENTRNILEKLRALILEEVPEAEESIAYQMPAYKYLGHPLVYFAGFANHVGLYALPSGHARFAAQLSGYKQGKGSVQFPLAEPMPYDLIRDIVRFRAKENEEKYG
jgi:uncharacterized protein YdhG (YjbR/CyaY superfamily)